MGKFRFFGEFTILRRSIPGYGIGKFLKLLRMMVKYADTSPTEFSIALFMLSYTALLTWYGPSFCNDYEYMIIVQTFGYKLWLLICWIVSFGGIFSLASCYPRTEVSRMIRMGTSFITAITLTFMGMVRFLYAQHDLSYLPWIGMGFGAWWLVYRSERVFRD